jgi:mono/diheme cytochrome c family protein
MRASLAVFMLGLLAPHVSAQQQADSLLPEIPRGEGEQCVADTDLMRREHMNLLSHQRDETTHQGLRTKQFSLKECVACHAVAGPDAQPVSAKSPRHFCRACHDYAAVKIDCFECHASRPSAPALTGHMPELPRTVATVR